jgi:hypothetical protein
MIGGPVHLPRPVNLSEPASMMRARRLPAIAMALVVATCSLVVEFSPAAFVSAQGPGGEDLPVGGTVTGRLSDAAAVDRYRFTLAAIERVAVSVNPPPDGSVAVSVYDTDMQPLAVVSQPTVGSPWAWVGQLPPGQYEVELRAGVASQGEYRLAIERLDPFAVSQDQEPNDTPARARPMPPFLKLSGTRDADGDIDWYSLGSLAVPTAMTFTTGGAPGTIHVSDGTTEYPDVTDATGLRHRTVMLPAGVPLYLVVTPDGGYEIHIDSGAPSPSGLPIPARLIEAEMSMSTTPSTVAAGWDEPQRLPGILTMQNEDRNDEQLTLDGVTSDQAWSVSIDEPQVVLPGYSTVTVPVVIVVPSFARADVAVRITIRARDAGGGQSTGFVDIIPTIGAPPVTH